MSKEVTKFLKVREVLSPSRAYPNDAGIDFYVPKFTKSFIDSLKNKNEFLAKEVEINRLQYGSIIINGSHQEVILDQNKTHFKYDESVGKLYFILPPQSRVLIPSGIHVRMSNNNRALIAANKSGVASKMGLIFGSQVVDYSYKGEIHISVINTSTDIVRIYEDMKIIQFIETPVITNQLEISEAIDDNSLSTFYLGMIDDRKDGGFGSTSKNN